MAGYLGASPDDWTLRDLLAAFSFRDQLDWQHTATVCAVVEAYAGMNDRRRTVRYSKYDHSYQRAMRRRVPDTSNIQLGVMAFVGENAPLRLYNPKSGEMTHGG